MDKPESKNLREQIDEQAEEIVDYVKKTSPRPSVDADAAERLLSEAPPGQAAAELDKMAQGFHRGAGAATGRRNEPADGAPPTDDLDGTARDTN
jgi:hypothetical protein